MQKYKVFFNENSILFRLPSKITLSKPLYKEDDFNSKSSVLDWFERFVKSGLKEAVLEHANPEWLFNRFRSAFIAVDAAGGVVGREDRLLFIFRNGKWDLPKGKIDDGEEAKEAAVREIEEECGIYGHQVLKTLPSTYHIYQSPYKENKGQWILKETFWFEMEYHGDNDGKPQEEEGITQVKWFKKEQLDEVWRNTYENLKQIIGIYRD